ncbi:RelA/SpoT domain-containing protein (plasmid) [Tistrella mobilis]|uniref:RelA/SpoT domain-containing protein n=1 Tax=Tistrella mobilis TaxID=171437 RepID=UPI0035562814
MNRDYDETSLEMDDIFEEYRKNHLQPLTELTVKVQNWLSQYNKENYVAQRLKRRPQILRKLRRLSVRLSQLQDIGGCRIIVENNADVDYIMNFIQDKMRSDRLGKIIRRTDYRQEGRDNSGYRALHVIIEINGYKLELQIRSRMQHYWSESIERTSLLYGHRLKEGEGDSSVIQYFKKFSNILYKIESGLSIPQADEIALQDMRVTAESIISAAGKLGSLGGHVNSNIIREMSEKERRSPSPVNNWILVLDWSDGNFAAWDLVSRDVDDSVRKYSEYERMYPNDDQFEVVLIGSSRISSVYHTHSHYFGIEHHNRALESMEESIIGISKRSEMDVGARRILFVLKRRQFWGNKSINIDTLKNHLCKDILTFESSIDNLRNLGFINTHNGISLNLKKAREINEYV